MEATLSSSSESLTSRSTESMEIDSPRADTPELSSSRNTPLRDTNGNSLGGLSTDTEKSIIVTAPTMDLDDSAILVDNSVDEDEDEDVVTGYPKRKRTSVNYILEDLTFIKHDEEPPIKRGKMSNKIRGVLVGVWRDSDQPDDEDKHVIHGFIDIHDRLRTRIYGMDRRGEELGGNIPTGAGGCWVTFPRIIFDPHLRDLSAAEVKEYVRIRSESKPETSPEARREADQKAVLKAKAAAAELEAAGPTSKPIVHRPSFGGRPSTKEGRSSLPRQSLNNTPSFKAINASTNFTPKGSPPADPNKPSGVLLGYWVDSDSPRPEDKHAAYGVLGHNDCFRIKVQKITRDGRYVDGNFPVGAGAMWLHYDKVVFEPHFAGMSRPEIKEYVRIRQHDLENRETEKERKMNEAKAVKRAKEIIANGELGTVHLTNGAQGESRVTPEETEVRHRVIRTASARQQPDPDLAAEKARREKIEAREKINEKTRKEVATAEALLQEAAQAELKNNLKKLNKVWVAQQAASIPGTPNDEVKYHNGIKYERKQTGPLQGKLVSAAQILNIDGEDYVEYRVLTKPSFF